VTEKVTPPPVDVLNFAVETPPISFEIVLASRGSVLHANNTDLKAVVTLIVGQPMAFGASEPGPE